MRVISASGLFLALSLTTIAGALWLPGKKEQQPDIDTHLILANSDYGKHQILLNTRTDISQPDSEYRTYLTVSDRVMYDDSIELIAEVEQVHSVLKGNYNLFTSPSLTLKPGSEGSIEIGSEAFTDIYWRVQLLN